MNSIRVGGVAKLATFYLLTLMIAVVLCGVVGESFLRVFWHNPYAQQPVALDYAGFVRLQTPNVDVEYDVTDLYPGQNKVRFRTGPDGHVLGEEGAEGMTAHFYGGSTTECRYIPEGSRWPENVGRLKARNWGVSGNHLIDSYFNFKFHLERGMKPELAVFMHAVNDFSARNVFEIGQYTSIMGEARRSNRAVRARSYFFDFVRNLYANWFTPSNVRARIVQAHLAPPRAPLDEQGFQNFLTQTVRPFLQKRAAVLEEIRRLADSRQVKLVLVTQPHAYGANYVPPPGGDIRDLPVIDGNFFLNHAQIGKVLDLINQNTRQVALAHDVMLIDASRTFESRNVSDLFYDGVHYTEKGALLLARVVSDSGRW